VNDSDVYRTQNGDVASHTAEAPYYASYRMTVTLAELAEVIFLTKSGLFVRNTNTFGLQLTYHNVFTDVQNLFDLGHFYELLRLVRLFEQHSNECVDVKGSVNCTTSTTRFCFRSLALSLHDNAAICLMNFISVQVTLLFYSGNPLDTKTAVNHDFSSSIRRSDSGRRRLSKWTNCKIVEIHN
jgi:hypothetical protein